MFPILNSQLVSHFKNHGFLTKFADIPKDEQDNTMLRFKSDKQLTEKEAEVVKLLLQGYTYKMMARNLFITENTIKYHIKNIYQKLNIKSKMELIKMFVDNEELYN